MEDIKLRDRDLEEAINTLATGSAICFLGAGFSSEATDQQGESVPSSDQLAEEICKLIGVPRNEGGSLSDLADYCQSDNDLGPKLSSLLLRRLTLCKPTPEQTKILSAPWRSIFTTNFDDIAERALAFRKPQIITPNTDAKVIVGESLPIYYVHGRALDILENKGDPKLVLSETNYLELKQRNAALHAAFINEVHCANKVFFIGYSLRDTEIASRLFAISETLRSKSIVICGPKDGKVAQARLEKFGKVFAIGLDGLAKILPSDFGSGEAIDTAKLAFVRPLISKPASEEITRDDIDRLIISGEFDSSKFATQKNSGDSQAIYCVDRAKKVDEIFDGVANNINRFVAVSDIGNGKSMFLDQLAFAAQERGYEVYRIGSRLTEVFKDLEYLLKRKVRQIFLVDDIIRNRDAAAFIGARLSGLGVLVCTARDALDDTRYAELSNTLGSVAREIDLDHLSEVELKAWDSLLERWGFWEQRISLTERARFEFLKNDCSSENRSIVVSIFRSSRIAEKIRAIVSYFLTAAPQHAAAFVAILICSLCQKHVEWEKVVQWLGIDERSLRNDMQKQVVFDFMSGRREWYKLTSTQLADHIFKHFDFDENLLVDIYVKIVRETAYGADDRRSGFDSSENLKELMKYRFLTRIFGDGPKALTSIEAIYKRLSSVPKIRLNDQFWLQYAMSSMEIENIADAETYLNTALGIASKKGLGYSNHQILDQQARLLLLKNRKVKGAPNSNELNKALSHLETALAATLDDKIYPLRSAEYILGLVEEKIDNLDLGIRARFLAVLTKMQEIVAAEKLEKTKRGEADKLKRTIRDAILVLKNA